MTNWDEECDWMPYKLSIGDLVEFIDIGDGTDDYPWTEAPAVGIYLGKFESTVFSYSVVKDLSAPMDHHAWHIIWSRGRRRHVCLSKDIKLLSSRQYLQHGDTIKSKE